MCSFLFSTLQPETNDFNTMMSLRGPDSTVTRSLNGHFFCHNLLSMRGDFVAQPYVSDDEKIVIMFNGEIYSCPDSYESEVRFLHDLYTEHGAGCFSRLDGEYAIILADYEKNTIFVARDCFGTKPLYFGSQGNDFGFASYRGALAAFGFSNIRSLKPNHVVEYAFDNKRIVERETYTFNIAQYKTDLSDWFEAFDKSVAKRVNHLRGKPFVGLSSGYDSGAIAASLIHQNKTFISVTIEGREDPDVVQQRFAAVEASGNQALLLPETELDLTGLRSWLQDRVEDQPYFIINDDGERTETGKSVHTDKAALMLAGVCTKAKAAGALVYLSGSGADEIVSDYGFGGKKFFAHSNFGGQFPPNFLGQFPWSSFFGSTQAAYLSKEEMVAGSFGMEARYPFLDRTVVQEFLNLTSDVKNKQYKSAISEYLKLRAFSVKEDVKIGFGFKDKPKKKKKTVFSRIRKKILN
ncbi:asparagine synthase-related protein [uncultured Roseibium sp.]|uniref:asparagine synthase-related protein n=1 Tax=uncultured Roseibium sp. TaxID=1936171 RepID=UPI0026290FA1|nr:asparagine synthase-related protein [uncultured Roseibium sp.]